MLTNEELESWATELESGKWQQCRLFLSTDRDTKYCCLGVLWYSLHIDPNILGNMYSYFVDLNDTQNLTFPEIALKIRELKA